ncbi:MAG: hypothetical protein HC831_18525 [Chloroflexia bacterium]|nr:hypothetical protein [Chloroflexia bacterium]
MDITTSNYTTQNIVYDLFKAIQKDRLNYVYRGIFTDDMTRNILELTENNLLNKDDARALTRKVYHVMVEGLQNITRHQAEIKHNMGQSYGLFALKKENSRYFLTTGNIVENNDIESLSTKIDKVNRLDKVQLKEFHREIMQNGELSEKGGAGLGLIDIARRAGSKLLYAFNKISDTLSYFYLHTEITSTASIQMDEEKGKNLFFDFHRLHPMLNNENILMVFNNTFNQSNLLDLLPFIEKQMAECSHLKRKIYNILIEMFQNISKHGSEYQLTEEGKSGLFYISEDEIDYYLATGNYIKNNDIKSLRGRLNYVNNLDSDGLEDFYEKRLFDFDINSETKAGLGLIDLRIKSGEKLDFDFIKGG